MFTRFFDLAHFLDAGVVAGDPEVFRVVDHHWCGLEARWHSLLPTRLPHQVFGQGQYALTTACDVCETEG